MKEKHVFFFINMVEESISCAGKLNESGVQRM